MPATQAVALAAASQKARIEGEERAAMTPRGTVDRDGRVTVTWQDIETPTQYQRRDDAADRKVRFVMDNVTVLDAFGRPVDLSD